MNAISSPQRLIPAWQSALTEAFTRPAELLEFLRLPADLPALKLAQMREFPLRVPRAFAEQMEKGNPRDPLFLQVWPQAMEAETRRDYVIDAVGDLAKLKPGGIIHKYHGRALVIATGACAVNCRYCFRRHFPYGETRASRNHWKGVLAELADDDSIEEVILSGGDPLSLTDDKLADLVEGLAGIPHLKRLRVHSRQPIVLPERVNDDLLDWLTGSRLQPVLVLHANHAQELSPAVAAACERLKRAGVPLLNQSVLLAGINDSLDVLKTLSERLFESGVLPYYLHLLDRVQGAAHFEVDEAVGKALVRELAGHLPGYLVPRLVREIPGKPAKTWIAW
ncbi:EF-P beta-lysylation protein EpmB [Stagnimonas aquatica]|uniref:L-lysine 2,3-aminomutase n=1 Tax=Stagnimonas aquatica TaxID=2689987 RepID=A0A3N0VDX6_9GAMM|nr:EF-P beta-lysylation protein EpmB [Stagnimonas aquatica]ROH90854.1 EF-P beta-lysylation protein EpmB [Stagnimonas aquatica]